MGKTLPFLFDRKKRCAYNKGVILKNRRRTEEEQKGQNYGTCKGKTAEYGGKAG